MQQYLPFTVLKPEVDRDYDGNEPAVLQQYLPFTVLKPFASSVITDTPPMPLQQYLPFTVLKPEKTPTKQTSSSEHVATVLTVYGIETP